LANARLLQHLIVSLRREAGGFQIVRIKAKSRSSSGGVSHLPSVLLVDDDVELLRQMAAVFSAGGFEVLTAGDGQAALTTLSTAQADLVVTDIIMPVREGVETIMALKARAPDRPVIAISGGYRVGPGEFLKLARHLGADDVLAKPFRPSELLAAANRLLTRTAKAEVA
jgi:DNA-binding response OmpR family regulator